jgi:homoserine O-succinyltransferase
MRYARGEIDDYPPFPDRYFNRQVQGILAEHRERVIAARARNAPVPALPEHLVVPTLDNTWHDTAEAVIDNWIGKVYELTNRDRKLPFMDGIDPEDPLGLRGTL